MTALNTAQHGRTAAATPGLLEVAALGKQYRDQHALVDVSFDIRAGEVLGLIGPNGAGKTTLLEAVAGLLPVEGGRVLWAGRELPLARRRDVVFYLPDGLRPWDDQYAVRVVEFVAAAYGRSRSDVAAAVHTVGLVPVLGKRVSALSKGYARRLMLALALIAPHPVLLLDEPFDGFDLRQTRDMMAVVRRLAAEGRALVLAIHQLTDAERICDRFVLLQDGRVRGVGALDALRAQASLANGSLEDVFLALT
jgi:ABC-2 type transport system ATP-binding protein